jgi:hypothetical protein
MHKQIVFILLFITLSGAAFAQSPKKKKKETTSQQMPADFAQAIQAAT